MKQKDFQRMADTHFGINPKYDGDNSEFIVYHIIPFLKLSAYDKCVVKWAYGVGEKKSYELESDGETGVKDYFLNGAVKCPAGVVHDYINRVPVHTTPDGRTWTRQQSNRLYLRIAKALGYPPLLRWRRFLFLSATRFWWKKPHKK